MTHEPPTDVIICYVMWFTLAGKDAVLDMGLSELARHQRTFMGSMVSAFDQIGSVINKTVLNLLI